MISKWWKRTMVLLASLLIVGAVSAPAQASEDQITPATFTATEDGTKVQISLEPEYQFDRQGGQIVILAGDNTQIDVLPTYVSDENQFSGTLLSYTLLDESTVEVSAYKLGFQNKGWWNQWGRCVAGITGGTGAGALGGAGVGSAVPVLGTGVGATVGGVSGALTGAAASC